MSSTHPPPGQYARLADVRGFLDDALLGLRAIADPRVERAGAEEQLATAQQLVYSATAERAQWLVARGRVDEAMDALRSALAMLQRVQADDPALQHVTTRAAMALGHLSELGSDFDEDMQLPRRNDRKPLHRASSGTPTLIDVARAVIRPAIPLDEAIEEIVFEEPVEDPPAAPVSMERLLELAALHEAELEAAELEQYERTTIPEAPASPVESAISPEEVVRAYFGMPITDRELRIERARDCMEDLAMLGRMRRPTPDEPWASGEDSEARMLTKIDAIVACGADVWPELVRMLDDRPLPDPELTFGNVFFLCCIAGDDTFDEAMRLVKLSDVSDPEMAEMVVDALVFAPHPRIDETLPRWIGDPDPARRVIAIDILRRRGTLTPVLLDAAAFDPDPGVLAAVARALPSHRNHASPGLLSWLLHHEDEAVVRAALEAAAWMCADIGYQRAVELAGEIKGDFAEAAMFIAISGSPKASVVLQEEIATDCYPVALRALGWRGDPTFVPFLLGRLRDGDEKIRPAALDALQRITGASLTEADPSPKYRKGEEPFVRARMDHEPVTRLLEDPGAWESWWKAHGRSAKPERRYRWGHVSSAEDNVHELSHGDFSYRDRPFAAMELNLLARRTSLLDYQAWIGVQRAALARGTV